ncbi:class A beta-lactamase [uncultured Sphingomonas sp.]|uniref:class A beta-lactamase n=1 Tax=uncultured Sphingomonas sp. TaxID=158754 RepID=UPI0025D3BDEA|nr:class A beta-lactamase [uncultured Sphingomonas sp.]
MVTRRQVCSALLALAVCPAYTAAHRLDDVERDLAGGRLGFAALDLASGAMLVHRAHQRFALCSTVKLPLVAAILADVHAGRINPDRMVRVGPQAAQARAPEVQAALPDGALSIAALCAATMIHSDNAAANLLLPLVGGPAGLTRFMRAHGGGPTRLDRTEPALNTNLPGDRRDTTTPWAMLSLMRNLLGSAGLAPVQRERLAGWAVESRTGLARLRAGLPPTWRVGDKTGTGERGATNDVAIAWPAAGRPPVLMACYVDAPNVSPKEREDAHCRAARIAAAVLV